MFSLLEKITMLFARNFVSRLMLGRPNLDLHRRALSTAKNTALYVHIPFCLPPLCKFCSFVRYPLPPREVVEDYYRTVGLEAEMYSDFLEEVKVGSIYFGGGTPTVCIECLVELIDKLRDLFGKVPVTVEANPRTIRNPDDLRTLRDSGVVRISIGVQSFQKWKLDVLGRFEDDLDKTRQIIREATKLFDTVNIDIVWGVKGETQTTLIYDAIEAYKLKPHQVTFYPIMPPLLNFPEMEKLESPLISEEIKLYATLLRVSIAKGYYPETPWCMVKGYSQLIDEYITEFQDFVGIGVSSIGKVGKYAYVNTFVPNKYIKLIRKGRLAVIRSLMLNTLERVLFDTESALFGFQKPRIRGSALQEIVCFLHSKAYDFLKMGKKPYENVFLLYTLHLIQKTLYSGINALRKLGVKYKL